jgi:hypothetical protein
MLPKVVWVVDFDNVAIERAEYHSVFHYTPARILTSSRTASENTKGYKRLTAMFVYLNP